MTDPDAETEADAKTEADSELEGEKAGTFVVTHADDASAVVRDVDTAQVHTLSSNPGFERGDVVEATVAPDPPLEVSWQVVAVDDRRTIDLIDSDLEPTTRSKEIALEAAAGELVRTERAGRGEIHVVRVPNADDDPDLETAAQDVLTDAETIARAARLEAVRVEVRRAPAAGVLSVRYLPE